MKSRTIVIVFARAPTPGQAKTRLAPRLGPWRAARLQARLTLRALATARNANLGQVELHATPRAAGAFFQYCKRRFGLALSQQRGSDLGERMHRALSRTLRRHRAAILIGTDCPALRPSDLRRAARILQGACDVVLAPAEDGGYTLIGASRISRAPFEGIAWGGSSVYADTVHRLSQSGHLWRALRTLWDVDRPEDLDRLAHARRS